MVILNCSARKLIIIFLFCFFPQANALRIISLSPNLTEMLFAIGAGAEIVAVDSASDTPKAVQQLPKVSGYQKVNLEKIIALHPDMVVAWPIAIQQEQLQQLKKFNINVYYFHPKKLTDIASDLKKLGRLTNHQAAADQAAKNYLKKLTALQKQYQHQASISVFYEVWQQPLLTIDAQSVTGQILNLCGAQTIFPEPVSTGVSVEAVIERKPQIIIVTNFANTAFWQKWSPQSRIIVVSADQTQRFAPSVLEGAAQLCRTLR